MSGMEWHISGAVFVIIAGTLWHFAFRWLGSWPIAGAVFPVNESVWEHLKLAYFPTLIWAFIEQPWLRAGKDNFWLGIAACAVATMVAIITIYYVGTAFTNRHILWLDIANFVVSVMLGFVVAGYVMGLPPLETGGSIARWVLIGIGAAMVFCTFFPPPAGIFRDPLTSSFGVANWRPPRVVVFRR